MGLAAIARCWFPIGASWANDLTKRIIKGQVVPHALLRPGPNPGEDFLQVDEEAYMSGLVSLYDALGRRVIQRRVSTTRIRIDTRMLVSGASSVEYRAADQLPQRAKWIKQ